MEAKALIKIFREEAAIFWLTLAACLLLALCWYAFQREHYQATLLLNIGRSGIQNTSDYTYDAFYRLQADERFADTVVRWLGDPRVVDDIYAAAHLETQNLSTRDFKRIFSAGRLSSQVVEVSYGGEDPKGLQDLSLAISTVLNRYTESLNQGEPDPSWFAVLTSDPVIRDARIGIWLPLLVGLVVGVFFGFWAVILRHYFKEQ